MQKSTFVLPALAIFILAALLAVSSWVSPGALAPMQAATPAITPEFNMPPEEDSWVLVDLPPDATQLEYGAEVYRLVCKACHGDKGQGLTADWRAQWAPEDQNCWQSKCHARNHPPDGFFMPIAPAVVGPYLMRFDTALALYNYISVSMPWYERGSMTQKDNWSVTAYILKVNNIDPGPNLNPETAARIPLGGAAGSPASPAPPSAAAQEIQGQDAARFSPYWAFAIITLVVLALLLINFLNRGSRE